MAKVSGPFMSRSASGSLGDSITMLNQLARNIARRKSKPTGAPSLAQLAQRGKYAAAVAAWNALSSVSKESWRPLADSLGLTPFNVFVRSELQSIPGPAYADIGLVPGHVHQQFLTATASGWTIDWSSSFTPSSGNLLFLVWKINSQQSLFFNSPGWVEVSNQSSGSMDTFVFVKENCSPSDLTFSGTGGGGTSSFASVLEISGARLSGAYGPESVAESESFVTVPTVTCPTGTTGTLNQPAALAIASVVIDGTGEATPGWTDGFISVADNQGVHVATKQITSDSPVSSVYEFFGSDQAYGSMVVLYAAAI